MHVAMTQLIDSLGRKHTYLRVAVTDRCNLRCTYCMPASGICHGSAETRMSLAEVARICRVFSTLGISKVRFTGGEPLVRDNIVEIAANVARLPGIEHVGITTNGVLLASLAADLAAAGVTRMNVSLDTLQRERFRQIALRDGLERVLAGIEAGLKAGFEAVRLNVVVIPGVNEDELFDFVEFVRHRPICVRFIEFMPVGREWSGQTSCIPTAELIERLSSRYSMTPVMSEGMQARVAKEFRIDRHTGTVAFITTVTDHFCGGCNRMRITADGALKTCLHYPAELNLCHAMRNGASDSKLGQLIMTALLSKREGRPSNGSVPEEVAACMEQHAMFQIGG